MEDTGTEMGLACAKPVTEGDDREAEKEMEIGRRNDCGGDREPASGQTR